MSVQDMSMYELVVKTVAEMTVQYNHIQQAARKLVAVMPESEIELAREVWGNANTRIIKEARDALAAALGDTK